MPYSSMQPGDVDREEAPGLGVVVDAAQNALHFTWCTILPSCTVMLEAMPCHLIHICRLLESVQTQINSSPLSTTTKFLHATPQCLARLHLHCLHSMHDMPCYLVVPIQICSLLIYYLQSCLYGSSLSHLQPYAFCNCCTSIAHRSHHAAYIEANP